ELAVAEPAKQNAGKPVWIPGRLPKSTQQLIEKLSYHEIVLLEGPPGTGKTYAIRNLLIDYICRGKRVLVVSDQQAAIEALIEKIQEYLYQGDKSGANKESRDALLFSALKVIDRVPDTADSLSEVLSDISPAFKVMEHAEVVQRKTLDKRVSEIDNLIQRYTGEIRDVMKAHLDEATPYYKRLPHKTLEKVNAQALLSFLQVISRGDKNNRGVVQQFIEHRVALIARGMHGCYGYFKLPDIDIERVTTDLQGDISILRAIVDNPPSTQRDFAALIERASFHEIFVFLKQCFLAQIEQRDQRAARVSGVFVNKKNNTLETHASFLVEMVSGQIQLLERLQHWPGELKQILDDIHETIRVADKPTLALSIYYHLRDAEKIRGTGASHSVQQKLEQVEDLIVQRDQLVYERFVARLHGICGSALDNKQRSGTNAITRILALVENLQQFKSIDESGEVFAELRDCLLQTFPVWVLRKQLVPLLLPCQEKSFDLVIVDEATQCRVDDALSLMFRAKKVLVVGDDKQTVLQKDSVVDDYLFKDHELDEHLRSTQARGFKGGGSNIFALVKSIKQAEVMLDEHYRCPADIIQFSNRYVYDNQLKVMQWRLPEQAPAVVVDDSETKLEPSKKPTSGKFKGVETLMIERFLVFVRKAILRLEKDLGRRINLESEVALCYFLLKNEPYVSQALNDFLSQMNRGESILHGAGAALQGKERDYIFYFWDMTRYNTAAFAQGDEEDKRRGELNVLMSRPKKIAFHYLHHAYHNLDHGKANIVKYLGGFLTKSGHSRKRNQGRLPQPQQFFYHALSHSIENSQHRGLLNLQNQFAQQAFNFRENIVVGNALKQVDLVIFPERDFGKVTGVVDLSYFAATEQVGDDVLDYYFQLKRAQPPIDPVFLFNYELADVNSFAFQSLVNKLIS
nr:UvrD-helicase domain-containing protein [Cellvibrionaceae bacterium]